MAEGINDVTSAERVRSREVERNEGKDLNERDKSEVAGAADRVDPSRVQGQALQTLGAGQIDAGDGYSQSGARVAGAASVGAAEQQVRGALIDRRSARLQGPPDGAAPPPGGLHDVHHFTDERGARGMVRNGPRAGQSGMAFFTTQDRPAQAGRGAGEAPWRASVGVHGDPQHQIPYRAAAGEASWRGFYEQARAANPGASEGELHARRNAAAQEYMRGRPEESFRIQAERSPNGQAFEARRPNALAGAEVNGLEPRVNGRTALGSSAADAARGRFVANEVLSGNADSAARAARATGMGEGAAQGFSRAATVAKWAGRVAVPLGVAADVAAVATSDDPVRTGVEKAAAWGTAFVGAKGGAALGASIGAFGGPVGAAVGGIAGGVIGGIGGYFLGENAASRAWDGVRSLFSW